MGNSLQFLIVVLDNTAAWVIAEGAQELCVIGCVGQCVGMIRLWQQTFLSMLICWKRLCE